MADRQTIISGKGAYLKIADILKEKCTKKVFLVCDAAYKFLPVKDFFESLSLPVVKFSDFTVNPLYDDVCKGVEVFKREECDIIIAVGGGSTIDTAKCIKLYSEEKGDVPFIALPTTAGTGSESTRFAVIYRYGEKQSINDISIIPDYAILESSVLESLPLYQKKCAVLDALCQGVESWWSVNSTEESRGCSKIAIRIILDNLDGYVENCLKNDSEAVFDNIMLGANYAGRAINITQTTAPHAMSYKLTSLYKIPHGHAVAICLPNVLQYMLDNTERCIDPRGEEYLAAVFEDIASEFGCKSARELPTRFAEILKKLEMTVPAISEEELDLLAKSVNTVRLKNNPIALSEDVLRRLYSTL